MTLIAGQSAASSRSEERGRARRLRVAAALTLASLALAGCQVSEFATGAPHEAPIPVALERKMERLGMTEDSPILIRLFKEESALEVWKQDRSGRYKLLTEYEVCAWSGKLGPKVKEGDRQAPEGFYNVSPGLMNPRSSYHLAFNIGFPNAYDRSLGRTGSNIMVHGDCSSRGCFAIGDQNVEEIYALAREAFEGGQRSFQFQSFPFRMTPENLARHADSEHVEFWDMLKEGYDHFELTGLPPKVDICKGRYVFNAKPVVGAFSASAECPAFEVDPGVEQLVAAKRDADKAKAERLVAEIDRQKEREAKWAEREQQIASFFNTSKTGDDIAGSPAAEAASAADGETAVAVAAPVVTGAVPLPRPAPRATTTAEKPSGGGFRLWGRRDAPAAPVAVTAAAPVAPIPAAPVASVAAAAPAPSATVAAAPAPGPAIVEAPAEEPSAALGYQAEETEDGFFSSMAKGSRGLFRKAGDIFN